MDDLKKSIRPKLNLPEASSEIEKFQNEVLRPILKLQHAILVLFFISFSEKQKRYVANLSEEKLRGFIKTAVTKNTVFRNQLLGLIIGQLTSSEYEFYTKNPSEYNKRILQMASKRLLDSKNEFKK